MVEKIREILKKHQGQLPIIVMAEILSVMDEEEEKPKYDVEKVVEQLEEYIAEAEQFGCGCLVCDMIEVVRNGGVE